MTDNVVRLACPGSDFIVTLEGILERARAGEITSIAVAATLRDGDLLGGALLTKGSPVFALIGRIEALKAKIVTEEIDY